jgi:hypothetical protein
VGREELKMRTVKNITKYNSVRENCSVCNAYCVGIELGLDRGAAGRRDGVQHHPPKQQALNPPEYYE